MFADTVNRDEESHSVGFASLARGTSPTARVEYFRDSNNSWDSLLVTHRPETGWKASRLPVMAGQ